MRDLVIVVTLLVASSVAIGSFTALLWRSSAAGEAPTPGFDPEPMEPSRCTLAWTRWVPQFDTDLYMVTVCRPVDDTMGSPLAWGPECFPTVEEAIVAGRQALQHAPEMSHYVVQYGRWMEERHMDDGALVADAVWARPARGGVMAVATREEVLGL